MVFCKEDNIAEFQEAVEANYRTIRAYFRSLGVDVDSLQDMTQDTFMTAFMCLDSFKRGRSYSKWFRGIARIKYYEYCKAAKRRSVQLDEQALKSIEAEFDNMEEARGEGVAMLSALERCMEKLDEDSLTCLRLFYFEDKPSLEIADLQGVKDVTVRKRLQRLRESLYNCIKTAIA